MKKTLLSLIILILCIVIPVSAEDYKDAYVIFSPLFKNGETPWNMTKEDALAFVNALNGFECNYVRTERGTTNLVCRSDYKRYEGSYKIVIDFGFTEEYIRALEIQITHPDIDEELKTRPIESFLSDAYFAFQNLEYIQVDDDYLGVVDDFNKIFSASEVEYGMSFAFNGDSIYYNGEVVKDHFKDEHTIIISISKKAWFYNSQLMEVTGSDTGKSKYVTIDYDSVVYKTPQPSQ